MKRTVLSVSFLCALLLAAGCSTQQTSGTASPAATTTAPAEVTEAETTTIETTTETETAAETTTTEMTTGPETIAETTTGKETTTAETTTAGKETTTTETTIVTAADWKTAYREVLNQYQNSENFQEDAAWDLRDLDNDGTPELLISEGEYHAAGVLYYTYEDGKAIQLLNESGEPLRYGSYGEVLVYPAEQLLGCADMHMGYNSARMDKYANHTLTLIASMMENSGAVSEGEEVTYTVNEETVSQEIYDDVQEQFNAVEWSFAGRTYTFEEDAALE